MLSDELSALANELDELGGQTAGDCVAPDMSGTDFEIGRVVGAGGMGVVYEARQISLDRAVAVKAVRVERRDAASGSFENEAKLVARLHHPNIIDVYAAGATPSYVWYAMELIRGESAEDHRFADVAELVSFANIVAEALDYAHRCGIIHRDIKPSNVFVGAKGEVRLGDLGLAMLGASADCRAGTQRYMAPETVDQEASTALSDQYSLGLTLLELASRVRGARQNRDFMSVLDRMTADAPSGRYPDMRAVADDFKRILECRPIASGRPFHRLALLLKRNPAAGWGGLIASLLAVGLALSLVVGYCRTTAALTKADVALGQVESEAASAAEALASALAVLDRYDADKRETQLRRALESVRALEKRYPDNREIRAALGRLRYAVEAHRRVKAGR